jgi:CheY-like chemotaxis protein
MISRIQKLHPSGSAVRATDSPLIYAVDDVPEITELYAAFLEATGCTVRAFNDRAEALAALEADHRKPDLLITDCLGLSMPVDRFLKRCRLACPTLRILMASGFDQLDAGLSQAPDRYLQKPFTPEEFRQEVIAALAA